MLFSDQLLLEDKYSKSQHTYCFGGVTSSEQVIIQSMYCFEAGTETELCLETGISREQLLFLKG